MESTRETLRNELSPKQIAEISSSKRGHIIAGRNVNLAASQTLQPMKTISPARGTTPPHVNPNQNYFSKEYVDELQSFYQREREAYRTKIYNLEGDLESTKADLTTRIDDLNRQLERYKYTNDYLEKVESQNKQFTENIREKEHVTRT